MPTPEHNPNHAPPPGALEARQPRALAIHDNASTSTRSTRAVSWIGWHVGELAGVTVPLVLAPTVWPGFYALSGLAALAWTAHEIHGRRATRTGEQNDNGTEVTE